jgi:hypothetical protein
MFIIGSGPQALLCRYHSGRRRLDANDQLTLEWAGAYRHYHAALMNTFLIGEAQRAGTIAGRGVGQVDVEVRHQTVLLVQSRHDLPAQPEVQRQPGRDAPCVLNEQRIVPAADLPAGTP